MKGNLLLLIILGLLISIAYFSEERTEQARLEQEKLAAQLYDPSRFGALQGLETPTTKILKGGEYYYTAKDYRISDPKIVEKVFDILSNVKSRRHLTPQEVKALDRKVLFPDDNALFTFYFEKGNLSYLLGRKLDFDRSFYMEIRNSLTGLSHVVIAYDQTADEGAYPEEIFHRSPEKYNRLVSLLRLPDQFFHDLHLLRRTTVQQIYENWKKIEITSERNPAFSIDLEKKTTTPAPYLGLTYIPAHFEQFLTGLVEMRAQKLLLGGKKQHLKDLEVSYSVVKKSGAREFISLYRNYLGEQVAVGEFKPYYVHTSLSDDIFVVDEETAKLFRTHHQDFWKKQFFSADQLLVAESEFQFQVDHLSVSLTLRRQKGFEVRAAKDFNFDPLQSSFKKLFEYFEREADYALQLNVEHDDSNLFVHPICSIEWLGERFVFVVQGDDLWLINQKKNLALVFKQAAEEIPRASVNYFGTKSKGP